MTSLPTSTRRSADAPFSLVAAPRSFDLTLPALPLERGGVVRRKIARRLARPHPYPTAPPLSHPATSPS